MSGRKWAAPGGAVPSPGKPVCGPVRFEGPFNGLLLDAKYLRKDNVSKRKKVCSCGHPGSRHPPQTENSPENEDPRPCEVRGCDCPDFRPASDPPRSP